MAGDLEQVIDALAAEHRRLARAARMCEHDAFPSRAAVAAIVEDLRAALFPGYFGPSEIALAGAGRHIGVALERARGALVEQVRRGLFAASAEGGEAARRRCEEEAGRIVREFLDRLPEVRRVLGTDVDAAYEGDPAAASRDEAIFSYPGILAITSHRLAHELFALGVPLIPRIMSEHAHGATGIDIHPGARIGERFFVDHGTGVVIGETTVIGRSVRLYQGVTLGAKSFPLDEQGNPLKGIPRHPIVEDDVVIYSNATILGRVTIGRGSTIGGNVWLTRSVPPGSTITQAAARPERFEAGGGI
jgi:serine O-acetyltransferase